MDDMLFEYEFAIMTQIHNEARYIQEWLEYHYRLGVDKFYIYDIESEDRSELELILQPWIDAGVVDYNSTTKMGQYFQTFYDTACKHNCDCRYLCMLSVHEFIFYKGEGSLLDYLKRFFATDPSYAALIINRVHFGSSGEIYYKPGSVVERFIERTPESYWFNNRVTSIMNPRVIRSINHDSFAYYYGGAMGADSSYRYVRWEDNIMKPTDVIQVNSYYTKSKEEFVNLTNNDYPNFFRFRSEDIFNEMNQNTYIETDFRDFYREFMKRPLPPVKKNGMQIVFENVVNMLIPAADINADDSVFEGKADKFTMCFVLSEKIKKFNEAKGRAIEILSLESIYRAMTLPEFKNWTMIWLLDLLPELINSHSEQALNIIYGCKNSVSELMAAIASYGMEWEDFADLVYKKKLIDVLFTDERKI